MIQGSIKSYLYTTLRSSPNGELRCDPPLRKPYLSFDWRVPDGEDEERDGEEDRRGRSDIHFDRARKFTASIGKGTFGAKLYHRHRIASRY